MTGAGRRSGFSEGVAVAVASVVLVLGLIGLMAWQVVTRDSVPASEPGQDAEALTVAEVTIAGLREEVRGLKAQLRDAEGARLAAETAASSADQAAMAVLEVTAEKEQLEALVAELVRRNEELEAAETAPATEPVMEDGVVEAPVELPATVGDGHNVSTKVLHNVRVVDANKDLEYVVLNAGKQDGVRVGMVFHVMDGEDQVVATLRAADVRDDLTGSTVEDVVAAGRYPQPSDRVILGQNSDK